MPPVRFDDFSLVPRAQNQNENGPPSCHTTIRRIRWLLQTGVPLFLNQRTLKDRF
jgi:hypothetical protein